MLTPLQIQQAESSVTESEEQIMNTTKNDGGPAFPNTFVDKTNPRVNHTIVVDGLTKREWLVGMALNGLASNHETLLANSDLVKEFGTEGIDKLQAIKAVRLADAALAELSKP